MGRAGSRVTSNQPRAGFGARRAQVPRALASPQEVVDVMEVDAVMVATGRAPYTQGLNLKAVNAETDRRGFVPVNDLMQVTLWLGAVGEGDHGCWGARLCNARPHSCDVPRCWTRAGTPWRVSGASATRTGS